ncbi:MAG: phosphatidylglycerophosphatase A [Planctomycetota bacterium]
MPVPNLRLADRFVLFLATGFGLGWAPVAPGTFGSLGGLVLVYGLSFPPTWGYLAGEIAVIAAGVWICTRAGQLLGRMDPPSVVWDEIAAFPIVFAGVPLTPWTAILGFLWFRLFDIAKPFPINRLERLPRGWGVMSDDLMAGVFAALGLRATIWLGGTFFVN